MGRQYPDVGYSGVGTAANRKCLVSTMIIFNIVYAVLGAAMVALGFWITLDTDFKGWVKDLEMEHFWVGVYILMVAGCLVMLQAFFGVCGACQENYRLLVTFVGLVVVCFILELAGAGYMLANGMRHSKIEDWLTNRFYHLIDSYDYDEKSARIMNIIQEWVGCCGVYGTLDYVKWNKVIPYSCYNPVTGNAWYMDNYGHVGCVGGFTMYLENMAGWIAAVALFLAFFQMFGVLTACCMLQVRRRGDARDDGYYR